MLLSLGEHLVISLLNSTEPLATSQSNFIYRFGYPFFLLKYFFVSIIDLGVQDCSRL